MTIKQELRSGVHCGALTTVAVKRPNHILHAVLSVVTCGLWLPVWALAGLEALGSRPKAVCVGCRPKKRWWK